MHRLWNDKEKFPELLQFAALISCQEQNGTDLKESANYFIEFALTYFITSYQALVSALEVLSQQPLRSAIAKGWIKHRMVALSEISNAIHCKRFVDLAQLCDQDAEYAAQLNARHLIQNSSLHPLPYEALIPKFLELDASMQAYVLSWAYEENKLSASASARFAQEHPKKYKMLNDIKALNSTDSSQT
ncbi:hypothetical protein [Pseudomonas parafulva]|uniref:hypothetical protein n=1 Tax=Pseudomonas parafulva TaxID=157782 RepID=UPI0012D2BF07|nr:hypothetical protein [Pseudomonas parafulva]